MESEIRARLTWVNMYYQMGNASKVCRRCGITRPTLKKWVDRFEQEGLEGLKTRSKRPHHSPFRKIFEQETAWILDLRRSRNLGVRRIQSELLRLHNCKLAVASIHKVLKTHNVNLRPIRRQKCKGKRRYNRPIPGDRVQMDTCKIAPGIYQYTAIDDCTRYRVLGVYPRRNSQSSIDFLHRVIEEMPFPIQRIQTDRGTEFFAMDFQLKLMERCIKFRPIRPASPHLNGKVERSQRTDLQEFYATIDLNAEDLHAQLDEWQFYYNWHRPHSSLGGRSPMDKVSELSEKTPFWSDVEAMYDPSRERIREHDYRIDLQLHKLQRSP